MIIKLAIASEGWT